MNTILQLWQLSGDVSTAITEIFHAWQRHNIYFCLKVFKNINKCHIKSKKPCRQKVCTASVCNHPNNNQWSIRLVVLGDNLSKNSHWSNRLSYPNVYTTIMHMPLTRRNQWMNEWKFIYLRTKLQQFWWHYKMFAKFFISYFYTVLAT